MRKQQNPRYEVTGLLLIFLVWILVSWYSLFKLGEMAWRWVS